MTPSSYNLGSLTGWHLLSAVGSGGRTFHLQQGVIPVLVAANPVGKPPLAPSLHLEHFAPGCRDGLFEALDQAGDLIVGGGGFGDENGLVFYHFNLLVLGRSPGRCLIS